MKSATQNTRRQDTAGDLPSRWRGATLALRVALALMAAPTVRAQGQIQCAKIVLLRSACLPVVFAAADKGGTLKPQITERDSFTVIGIEIRTNNAAGDIPRQWDRFFKEGVLGKIPNKADANILAVYSRYASDHNGDYDYLIGARVRDGSTAPEGMMAEVIPKARYAVLTTERGPVGKVVSEAWQKIWALEDAGGLGGRRTYKADFEVYDQRSRDPNDSQVDIYVGVD
jgi:predicted transcriptional regulator YdeE